MRKNKNNKVLNRMSRVTKNDEVFQATVEYLPNSPTLECMLPVDSYSSLLISHHSDTIFRIFDDD